MIKKLDVIFYRSDNGSEPVREWLLSLSKLDKKKIGADIKTVQFGWPIGMPLVKNMSRGLWEIRVELSFRKIARILFFMDKDSIILVNGFIKKSQKTPKGEIDLAIRRKKAYINNK